MVWSRQLISLKFLCSTIYILQWYVLSLCQNDLVQLMYFRQREAYFTYDFTIHYHTASLCGLLPNWWTKNYSIFCLKTNLVIIRVITKHAHMTASMLCCTIYRVLLCSICSTMIHEILMIIFLEFKCQLLLFLYD